MEGQRTEVAVLVAQDLEHFDGGFDPDGDEGFGEGEAVLPFFLGAVEFIEAFFQDREEERACCDYYALGLC